MADSDLHAEPDVIRSNIMYYTNWRTPFRFLILIALLANVMVSSTSAQPARSKASSGSAETTYDSARIGTLAKQLDAGNKDALDQFWMEINGKAPLIEPVSDDYRYCWVTFIWHGNSTTRKVGALGDLPYMDTSKWYMNRLRDTDLWFKTERIPKDARFGYLLNENETGYRHDPLNPRRWAGRSVAELPGAAEEPWIRELPGVPKGQVIKEKIKSEILKEERSVSIYLPAIYDKFQESFNLLVIFDGESYGRDDVIPTSTILDNLIDKVKIPPMVAVLVNSQNTRDRDLLCSEPFENFLASELVPWVRQKYHATTDPTRTVVAGSSYGGLSAACTAFRHPDIFGNVLSQSGTFTYNPKRLGNQDSDYYPETGWLTRQFVIAPKLPLRFYLQVGRFEGLSFENRHLRDILEAKGYQVTFAEYSGNHDYLSWRNSLGEGLIALIGYQRFQRTVAP